MDRFLERLISRLVKSGNLTVTFAGGRTRKFGDGTGQPVHVRLNSKKAEREILLDPSLKFAEAFMDGDIDMIEGDVYDFLEVIFENAGSTATTSSAWLKVVDGLRRAVSHLGDWNTLGRSRANVQHHYDLSGELYDLFLDPDRQYSCAYYEQPDFDLAEAQLAKKKHIAAKLYMDREKLSVLDIGSGWGGMGLHLAREFDARVTGVTLSDEQFNVSNRRARDEGLAAQAEFKLLDYRKIEQKFDRIVSVGMFEHVGKKHYQTYFDKCAEILDDDGVMLLHTIGQTHPPSPTNAFIKKYIFPGGYIPSLSEMLPAIERSGLAVTDVEILRLHYAETLKAWRDAFMQNRDKAKELYDERFCRMWEFYLASSESGFRHQDLVVFQIQMAKKVDALPIVRDYITEMEHTPAKAMPAPSPAKLQEPVSAK